MALRSLNNAGDMDENLARGRLFNAVNLHSFKAQGNGDMLGHNPPRSPDLRCRYGNTLFKLGFFLQREFPESPNKIQADRESLRNVAKRAIAFSIGLNDFLSQVF